MSARTQSSWQAAQKYGSAATEQGPYGPVSFHSSSGDPSGTTQVTIGKAPVSSPGTRDGRLWHFQGPTHPCGQGAIT